MRRHGSRVSMNLVDAISCRTVSPTNRRLDRTRASPSTNDLMKDEYDFSTAERGKFLRGGARLVPPVHLDPAVLDYLSERAAARGSLVEFASEHAAQEGHRIDRCRQIAASISNCTFLAAQFHHRDLFAAVFLFGLVRNAGNEAAGRLGTLAAAEVIQHIGARPQVSLKKLAGQNGLPV